MIKRKLALVVGEDTGTRESIAQALERTGFKAVVVADTPDALRLGSSVRDVKLVVTGVVFEGGSGLEFAAQLRRAAPGVKVIYVSGRNDPVRIGCALDPASEYITKPFSPPELMAKVRSLFRSAASKRPIAHRGYWRAAAR